MSEEDEILADLAEDPTPKLEAVVSAIQYTVALTEEDAQEVNRLEKWGHLEGVLWRRRCHGVQSLGDEGVLTFSIGTGEANIDDVMQTIAEELDEITGRKMEREGADAWGLF